MVKHVDDLLLDELHANASLLRVHRSPFFWFKDFVDLIEDKDRRRLARRVQRHGLPYMNSVVSDHRLDTARNVPTEPFLELFNSCLFFNVRSGDLSDLVEVIVDSLDGALQKPQSCAHLMAKASFVRVSSEALSEECAELRRTCEALGLFDALAGPDDLGVVEGLLESNSFAIGQVGDLKNEFEHLFQLCEIESRHPLYATGYTLYVPPYRRLFVADAIDKIILESARHPTAIRKLSPRDFERFLARIFEGFGFEVQLTAQARDGGADLICLMEDHGIPLKIAVEAKRYAASNPVTVDLVRSFVGANQQIRANKLVYVTTSRYTRDAVQYASVPGVTELLELKQFGDIIRWSTEHSGLRV